jgi:hypothetical protein
LGLLEISCTLDIAFGAATHKAAFYVTLAYSYSAED